MSIRGYSKYIVILLLSTACATGSKGRALSYPLNDIKVSIKRHLPGPLHSISQNGRVYKTKAFAVPLYYRTKVQKKGMPARERAYATVSILGDSRPYVLSIEVDIEEVENPKSRRPSYVYCCRHRLFEKDLNKEIFDYLVKRNKNKDLIDEYQAF